jgi:inorganic phosphate transporter, PiT family
LTLIYGYLNGLHGSAIIVATSISTRAIHPRLAILIAAITIGLGPALLGVAVANTIGKELLTSDAIQPNVITAGLIGAIVWSGFTFWAKIPSSISQSLFGGLIGAAIAYDGVATIQSQGLIKILAALFFSPIVGLIGAFLIVRLIYALSSNATPKVNRWFNRSQVIVTIIMGLSFGANDGQKIIAMFALGLLSTGATQSFEIPIWVIVLSSCTISLGALIGGWRLIKTLGGKFYKIRPIHGFGAQLSAGIIILGSAVVGAPISGTQVVTTSILGAGSADRVQKVRWHVVQQITIGWVLTIPLSALTAAIAYKVLLRG